MRARFVSFAITAGLLLVGAPARANDDVCTYGDAQALFQELPLPVNIMRPRGLTHAALLENLSRCQYRVFRDGQTFTFHDDDWTLGGVVHGWDYVTSGISRAEAVADIELIDDHVYLARVRPDGTIEPAVEQPLMHTAYKDLDTPFGRLVFQHRAFIRQLPAGEYVSTWVSYYPGLEPETATVWLVIVPR